MFKASVAKRLVGSFTAVFYNVNFSFGPFTLYLGELIIIFIFEALMVGGFSLSNSWGIRGIITTQIIHRRNISC
jgi:hypothetical protein